MSKQYEMETHPLRVHAYEDVPLLTLRALRESEWLQNALLDKFSVLIIDEYQNLGSALHRIENGV